MKKRILIILLAAVMIFSGIMMAACNSSSEWEKEIDLSVEDDSNVPVPTYSTKFKENIENTVFEVLSEVALMPISRADIKYGLDEFVFPVCQNAKVSESSLNSIVGYFKSNKKKLISIVEDTAKIDGMSESKVETLYKSYLALFQGAIEVLNADDVGKIVYEVISNDEYDFVDDEVSTVAKEVGRDNFIIVSRLYFKILNLSLEKQDGMVGLMTTVLNSFIYGYPSIDYNYDEYEYEYGYDDEDYDNIYMSIMTSEMIELFLMDIQMTYEVYQAITDNEMNKLIEIFVDTYAAVNKNIFDEPMTSAKKQEFKTQCISTVADFRPVYTLLYKTSKKLNKTKLENYIKTKDEAIAYYICSTALEAYEKDLTSAEKTRISDMIKDILTNAQYYSLEMQEPRKEYSGYKYYDYYADEYVYEYYVYYDEYMIVKGSTKQFTVPAAYLSNPITMLKEALSILGKTVGAVKGNITKSEQALIDLFYDYGEEIGAAIYARLGIPNEGFYGGDRNYVEVPESALADFLGN